MIYTLTFNPAIDYYITIDKLINGAVNRTKTEKISFGGKGINVSIVLNELGIKSVALGFIGGFTGDALQEYLKQKGVCCDFLKVAGNTRINVKINDTDINAAGPNITDKELNLLYNKLDIITKGDFLVLSGSVPKCLPKNTYQIILEKLKDKGANFIVDAEKELLLDTLVYKPFLIKPNHDELGAMFNMPINDFKTALFCAKKLQQKGAQNVMVSMGEKGAVLLDKDGKTHIQAAPYGTVVSAVGAGDSAVAAFLAQYLKGGDYRDCLKTAIAAGSATAFSDGLATKEKIEEIKYKI